MTNVDSQRIREIRDNTKAMAEAFSSIANTLADALELFIATKTETQNSNLTFEKADECAKEYEELGLKELKELIEADRKDEFFREPTAEERKAVADYIDSISVPTGANVFDLMDEPQTCEDCKHNGEKHAYDYACDKCTDMDKFQHEDEPQMERPCNKCEWYQKYGKCVFDYCHYEYEQAHKDEPQTYKPTCNGECRNCEYRAKDGNYCMKTDCSWK